MKRVIVGNNCGRKFQTMSKRNAFDTLVGNKQQQQNPRATKSVGRPSHDFWDGFEVVYVNGKRRAKCTKCNQVLTNTAADCTQRHRWAPFRILYYDYVGHWKIHQVNCFVLFICRQNCGETIDSDCEENENNNGDRDNLCYSLMVGKTHQQIAKMS